MSVSIAAVVLAYNELDMLRLTLPAIKAAVDQVLVVDMGSTDGSLMYYRSVLGPVDQVVSYDRRELPLRGFAHARNHGAGFAKADWIFAIDGDEWIDPDQVRLLKAGSALTGRRDVLELTLRNHGAPQGSYGPDLPAMLGSPYKEETQRRIYRNRPDLRWEGLIHEELFDAEGAVLERAGRGQVTLHTLNQFKSRARAHEKDRLYAFMTLRALMNPELRHRISAYWWDEHIRDAVKPFVYKANLFAASTGLQRYDIGAVQAVLDESML